MCYIARKAYGSKQVLNKILILKTRIDFIPYPLRGNMEYGVAFIE